MEGSLWVTVRGVVAGQVPDYQGLVAGTRQQHVWVLEGGSEGSDPSAVALKGALENELFSHAEDCRGADQSKCDVELMRGFKYLEVFARVPLWVWLSEALLGWKAR